jgi:hypothetical protein
MIVLISYIIIAPVPLIALGQWIGGVPGSAIGVLVYVPLGMIIFGVYLHYSIKQQKGEVKQNEFADR